MKQEFDDILLERIRIAGNSCVPLQVTSICPEDMGDHMHKLEPLLAEMIKSYPHRAMAAEMCWERFVDTFRQRN